MSNYPRIATISKPAKVVDTPCYRCGGAGGFVGWPGFTCFRCRGNGTDPTYKDWGYPTSMTDADIEAVIAKREATNAKRRATVAAKKEVERDLVFTSNVERFPLLADVDASYRTDGGTGDAFLDDLARKARMFPLSDKQGEALTTSWTKHLDWLAEKAEKEAASALLPDLEEGTYDIVAVIRSVKYYENQWGGQVKMVVETDTGHRLFGTVPAKLHDIDVTSGDRVAFTATVSRSEDDRLFGYFSRPRSAALLERAETDA